MRKIRIIALFLSLLMAIQILPVRQIGSALSQNQWTEELPHGADEEGKTELLKSPGHPFILPSDYAPAFLLNDATALAYIHHSEQIPSNHSAEVVAPPPDALV